MKKKIKNMILYILPIVSIFKVRYNFHIVQTKNLFITEILLIVISMILKTYTVYYTRCDFILKDYICKKSPFWVDLFIIICAIYLLIIKIIGMILCLKEKETKLPVLPIYKA